jgi:hypothetical protein
MEGDTVASSVSSVVEVVQGGVSRAPGMIPHMHTLFKWLRVYRGAMASGMLLAATLFLKMSSTLWDSKHRVI